MSIQNIMIDEIGLKIATALMNDANLTSSQIGELVGLSASAANERVRKMKSEGVIRKIVALIDSGFMQMQLGAFIFVLVEGNENNALFLKNVKEHDKILECYHLTGEYSFLLKIRCNDTKELESIITSFLKGQLGVTKTMTQIILSSHKEKCLIID
ncbi:MAG: AsnC family transcriptional regulator [Rickettsiaceae bacterium]|jgi:Lrp/AsnC family leucine-responsive transcriptional regulator|nr:AsnC family transcriptional regulator [Rickettsiaceae bacterium]